jgi:hypothetical protein
MARIKAERRCDGLTDKPEYKKVPEEMREKFEIIRSKALNGLKL